MGWRPSPAPFVVIRNSPRSGRSSRPRRRRGVAPVRGVGYRRRGCDRRGGRRRRRRTPGSGAPHRRARRHAARPRMPGSGRRRRRAPSRHESRRPRPRRPPAPRGDPRQPVDPVHRHPAGLAGAALAGQLHGDLGPVGRRSGRGPLGDNARDLGRGFEDGRLDRQRRVTDDDGQPSQLPTMRRRTTPSPFDLEELDVAAVRRRGTGRTPSSAPSTRARRSCGCIPWRTSRLATSSSRDDAFEHLGRRELLRHPRRPRSTTARSPRRRAR